MSLQRSLVHSIIPQKLPPHTPRLACSCTPLTLLGAATGCSKLFRLICFFNFDVPEFDVASVSRVRTRTKSRQVWTCRKSENLRKSRAQRWQHYGREEVLGTQNLIDKIKTINTLIFLTYSRRRLIWSLWARPYLITLTKLPITDCFLQLFSYLQLFRKWDLWRLITISDW